MTNVVFIKISLCGGQNWHDGIVITPKQYACIAVTPFVRLPHLGITATILEWTPPGEEHRTLH